MSKKKKISNQNYMDFIVIKNPEIEYETNDKGQVTVMIEWRGFYHRIAQRFFKRPKVSAIKLDDYGSFLWQSINDQKTVHQLSLDLQSQFPKWKTTCPSDPVSGDFKGSSSDRAKGGLLICLSSIYSLCSVIRRCHRSYLRLGTLAQSETAAGLIQPALFKGCLQNSESSRKNKTTVTSGIRRSSQRSVRKTAIFQ